MDDISKYRWYQCDLIEKDGSRKFAWRFIAKSYQDAKDKIAILVYDFCKKPIVGRFRKSLLNRKIDEFDIFEVPDEVLSRYNLNKKDEVEDFYNRIKG